MANHSKTDFVKDLDFYEDTTVEEHIFKGAQYAICLIEIFGTGCWYQVLEKSVSELKKKSGSVGLIHASFQTQEIVAWTSGDPACALYI